MAEALELLFMEYAETLLFVDHDQPEILERHVVLDQPVCPNNDVDSACLETLQHHLLLPPCPKAG